MAKLLDFLSHSFSGGTDVDRPLELCLNRLDQQEWSQVSCFFATAALAIVLHPVPLNLAICMRAFPSHASTRIVLNFR